jgi:hypothetical protein
MSATEVYRCQANLADLELAQPFLSIICFLLAKGKIDKLFIALLGSGKWNNMLLHMAKIVPGIGIATRSETLRMCQKQERRGKGHGTYLEVFAIPLACVWGLLQPLFVFWNGKEITSLISFRDLRIH